MTTLVIPTLNDKEEVFKNIAKFIKNNRAGYDIAREKTSQYYGRVVKVSQELETLITDAQKDYNELQKEKGKEEAANIVSEKIITAVEQRVAT
ncbi:MAG: hypothetical protein QME68_07490, partial [Elusimicrobiota bacterium]|nr:hypothetical protein [Elusimicrobiota bacterium]